MAENGIIKIAVIGAESTGKSQLCESLAARYNTLWVPEFARDYFNNSDIYNYTQQDLVAIAQEQMRQEQELEKKASRFLFCDTTLITLKIWAELEFHQTPEFIRSHLPLISYNHYFITDNQVPWEQDAQRQNKFSREMIFRMNLEEVQQLGVSYTVITGLESQRLEQAVKVIERLYK